MLIGTAFTSYEAKDPDQHTALQRTSLALRRGGVKTTEQLRELFLNTPDKLQSLRDIGPKRMELIRAVLVYCREAIPDGDRGPSN